MHDGRLTEIRRTVYMVSQRRTISYRAKSEIQAWQGESLGPADHHAKLRNREQTDEQLRRYCLSFFSNAQVVPEHCVVQQSTLAKPRVR